MPTVLSIEDHCHCRDDLIRLILEEAKTPELARLVWEKVGTYLYDLLQLRPYQSPILIELWLDNDTIRRGLLDFLSVPVLIRTLDFVSARKPSSQSRTSSSSSSSSSDSDGNSPKSKTWFKRSSSPKVSFFASFRGSNTNTVSPVIPAMEEMQPLATDGEVLPRASPNLPWQLNLETVPHDSPLLFCNIFADVEHGQQQRRAMVFYTNVANALSRYVDIACTNFHTLMHDNGHRNVLELVAEALLMIPEDVFDLEDAAQSTSSAFVRPFVNALLNLAINWVGRQLEVDPHVVTLSVLSMGSMRSLIAHLSSIVLKYKEQVPRGIQLSIAHLMGLFIASNGFVPANPSALDSTDADADLPESAKNALLLILQNFSQNSEGCYLRPFRQRRYKSYNLLPLLRVNSFHAQWIGLALCAYGQVDGDLHTNKKGELVAAMRAIISPRLSRNSVLTPHAHERHHLELTMCQWMREMCNSIVSNYQLGLVSPSASTPLTAHFGTGVSSMAVLAA